MSEFIKQLNALRAAKASNTTDTINRADAVDALYGITPYKGTIPLESAIFNIQKVPSAERVGEWIFKTTDAYIERICSACGWSERVYHRNRNQDGLVRNYCPSCGCKMEGEGK